MFPKCILNIINELPIKTVLQPQCEYLNNIDTDIDESNKQMVVAGETTQFNVSYLGKKYKIFIYFLIFHLLRNLHTRREVVSCALA